MFLVIPRATLSRFFFFFFWNWCGNGVNFGGFYFCHHHHLEQLQAKELVGRWAQPRDISSCHCESAFQMPQKPELEGVCDIFFFRLTVSPLRHEGKELAACAFLTCVKLLLRQKKTVQIRKRASRQARICSNWKRVDSQDWYCPKSSYNIPLEWQKNTAFPEVGCQISALDYINHDPLKCWGVF